MNNSTGLATTSAKIAALTKHYGSTAKLQEAIRAVWLRNDGERLMLKTDAIDILYRKLPK